MITDVEMINIANRIMLIARDEAARCGKRLDRYVIDAREAALVVYYQEKRVAIPLVGVTHEVESIFKLRIYNLVMKENENEHRRT